METWIRVWFIPIVVLMLFPSALWMPLSSLYVDKPSSGAWIAVRTVLFVVGLASDSTCLGGFLRSSQRWECGYWIAAVGSCYLPSTRSSWTRFCGRHCSGAVERFEKQRCDLRLHRQDSKVRGDHSSPGRSVSSVPAAVRVRSRWRAAAMPNAPM